MTLNERVTTRVRTMCLALPEVCETSSWGHPNFRAGARTFATIEWIDRRPSIAFRQAPAEIDALLRRREFFTTPYGRGQWVSLWVDGSTDWPEVQRLLQRSYRLVALKRMIAALEAPTARHSVGHAPRVTKPTTPRRAGRSSGRAASSARRRRP